MTYVGILWIIGIICIIAAVLGKEVSFGEFKFPAAAEGKVRGVVAAVGVMAVAAGGALFIYPNGMQQPRQSPQAAATEPVITPGSASPAVAQSSSNPSPSKTSASPSPSKSSRSSSGKPLYLSSLTGTTDGGYSQVAPDSGPQVLGSETYPHSLAYPMSDDICYSSESITYSFSGRYHYLVAKVGASSPPGSNDGSSISFEVDTSSGNQLGTTSAKYGSPGDLRVNVAGQTSLTLTTSSQGCPAGNDAVWGNVELLP